MRSKRTRSTFRILPRSGRIAWFWRERPPLAEPPARIALDDEDFGLRRIALLAIGELAGQRGDAERALARDVARLARRFARRCRLDHLLDDHLAFGRVFLEPGAERLVDQPLDHRPHFGRDQLVLGLRGEFRVGNFHRQHRRQPFAAIVADQRHLFLLGQAGGFAIAGDLPRQRAAEARQMRAAVALRDVVGEGQHVLVVAVVPPHRDLDGDAVAFGLDGDRLRDQRLLGAVEIFDELDQAAVIDELQALHVGMARVGQDDAHAGIQEGEFAQPVFQRAVVELDHGEGLGRREERDLAAASPLIGAGRLVLLVCAGDRQRRVGDAMGEAHFVDFAVAADFQLQPGRQRVDHRDADAVQAARHLVGVLVELSAGMKLRHDDFGRRDALVMHIGRNAAAVVDDRHRTVGVQRHRHQVGMAGQRLVDGVVHHLVDHVVQARAVVGVADIHARPLADGIQALQNLDGIGAVFGLGSPGKFSDWSLMDCFRLIAAKGYEKSAPNRAPEHAPDIGANAWFSKVYGYFEARKRRSGMRQDFPCAMPRLRRSRERRGQINAPDEIELTAASLPAAYGLGSALLHEVDSGVPDGQFARPLRPARAGAARHAAVDAGDDPHRLSQPARTLGRGFLQRALYFDEWHRRPAGHRQRPGADPPCAG